jgi:hypothetical protein
MILSLKVSPWGTSGLEFPDWLPAALKPQIQAPSYSFQWQLDAVINPRARSGRLATCCSINVGTSWVSLIN